MAQVMSKAAYARRVGVKAPTLSNWIARNKLTRPALRSDGTIDVDLADAQLGRTVEPGHAAAARRRFMTDNTPEPIPGWTPDDQAQRQLLRARAVSATVDAERKRRELEAERGKYMLADDAEARWARSLSGFLLDVEQSFADLTFRLQGLDQRQMLLEVRRWWRRQRTDGADRAAAASAEEADFIEDVA